MESNLGSLLEEVTALPTVPQPLKNRTFIKLILNIMSINFSND